MRRRIAIHFIAGASGAAGIAEFIIAAREHSYALHHSHFLAGVAMLGLALLLWICLLIVPGSP